jgi:hypothetical protein
MHGQVDNKSWEFSVSCSEVDIVHFPNFLVIVLSRPAPMELRSLHFILVFVLLRDFVLVESMFHPVGRCRNLTIPEESL